ncbi:MAG: hypothetical protein IKZ34_03395 [Alphaproteobacteria bacterium]|nr:hypothetical protein [Alphaproteobacteria bacterium]
MAKRNVVDFKIINLSEEKFQELKEAGQIDPNALYATPDTTKERLDALEGRATSLEETKQDKATAVNYDNITNCITHIPQDIKLELNNGTLTLKAGSKYYYPDGTNTFNDNTTTTDLTLGPVGTYTGQSMVYLVVDGSALTQALENISGTTAPTRGAWYDTNTNYIKYYSDGSDTGIRYSFPIALATRTNGKWTSIEQVFNGFGYIGSTAFALPDTKWLSPDGRNADGTLKSTEHTNTSVLHMYYPYDDNIVLYMGENLLATSGSYVQSETEPTTEYTVWYKPSENILRFKTVDSWVIVKDRIVFGRVRTSTTGIKSFSTISAFHAVDYNNTEFIANQAMPSDRYVDLTLGASGATYTAPADGWFYLNKTTTGVNQFVSALSSVYSAAMTQPQSGYSVRFLMPVSKGTTIMIDYNAGGATNAFKFVYANGAK